MNNTKKMSKAVLIARFFGFTGSEAVKQIKILTETDKQELASAVARHENISQEDCDFEFVAY